MSETASAVVTYTPAPAAESGLPALRLTLEPERVAGWMNRATVLDIANMVGMARSGVSARHRQTRDCRWAKWDANGDLVVTLALWVWPSDIDLEYALTLPPGVTSAEPVQVREAKATKIWVGGSTGDLELPWLLEDAAFAWHPRIGVWDGFGRPASPPEIRQDKARLILSGERGVYGILCPSGMAVGWRHDISITYPIGDESKRRRGAVNRTDPAAPLYIAGGGGGDDQTGPGISITNADDIDVTATWKDENGETRSEEATLQIPDCAKALLEECPEGSTAGGGSIRVKPADDSEGPITVYYNSCNGRVLDVRRGK